MKLLKDPETTYTNSLIKKYGKNLEVLDGRKNAFFYGSNKKYLEGSFSIKRIRKYQRSLPYYEVDLEFKGKILASKTYSGEKWLGSEVLKEKDISKIKINRLIRKSISNDINNFLLTFGVEINHNLVVKKIEWV